MDDAEVKRLDDILEHHGVKGMHWGVRNDHTIASEKAKTSRVRRKATDVKVAQKPGKFVTTKGGKRQIASGDAVKVAATRQFAKKSTTDALTTKQIQEAVQRMNLEIQYHQLLKKTDRRNRGRKLIDKVRHSENGKSTVVSVAKAIPKAAAAAAVA